MILLTSTGNAEKDFFSSQYIKKGDELIYLKTPRGKVVEAKALRSLNMKIQGLSGIKPNELQNHQGALFIYDEMSPRQFWMPDTYFDLCIIFMNEKLEVIDLIKNAPSHPGRTEPPVIFKSRDVVSSHVLEVKSSSKICKNLEKGQKLNVIKGDHRQRK